MRIALLASLAACVPFSAADETPPLPSQDSFYTQPSNVSDYKPGQVIAKRQVSNKLNGFFGGQIHESVNASYQYLYRTTDTLGNPVAAVTTLLIPNNANPNKLLAYQAAYDSANNDCSTSYSIRAGANNTAASDIVFISAALNDGVYVVTSDYEGLLAQYVAGKQAGYATLDSVRAALNEGPSVGLSPKALYAMQGYSGGALASGWAAELQPKYAPELRFQGAAVGGVIANVTNVVYTINKGPFAGLGFAGIFGLQKAYTDPNRIGNLSAYVEEHLIPAKKDEFYRIAGGCLGQDSQAGSNKDLTSYFSGGFDALNGDVPKAVLADGGQMGTAGIPTMPMFMYKANNDEISPGPDTDKLVNLYCSNGATVEYHRDAIGEHVSEAVTGSASAFGWIRDRLNGVPVPNRGRCITRNVALSSLDPATALALPAELVGLLQSILGGPLGLGVSG